MYRLILLVTFALATAVWAQDDADEQDTAAEAATEEADEEALEGVDDFELDGQEDHTEEDDDVFKPTDVVSYQQSVPFPVDI